MRRWRAERKGSPLAKPWRFTRNVWVLRRELLALLFRRRAKPPAGTAIICIRCKRELTRPCKPFSPCHVFKWPEGVGDAIVDGRRIGAGTLVYARRQKPRYGQIRPDRDLRLKPF